MKMPINRVLFMDYFFGHVACVLLAILLPLFMASQSMAAPSSWQRGINLSHWLQYEGRQPMTLQDLEQIRKAGFDHVRLPFDPIFLGWDPEPASPVHLPLPKIAQLDAALAMIHASGLAFILDFHPEDSLRQSIEMDRSKQNTLIDLWQFLAKRYQHYPVDKLAFELLNEPQYYQLTTRNWNRLWQQLTQAVRQHAPQHLIMVGATHGSAIEGLEELAFLADDPNIAYVFHFYEPYLVTHYHAPWEPFVSGPEGMIDTIFYPPTRMPPSSFFGTDLSLSAWSSLKHYRDEQWGLERMRQKMVLAAKWAKQHHSQLYCTEFGVLRVALDEQSRANWLSDVRTALEEYHIGWSVWDYADLFGLAWPQDGKIMTKGVAIPNNPNQTNRRFDDILLKSLGLVKP